MKYSWGSLSATYTAKITIEVFYSKDKNQKEMELTFVVLLLYYMLNTELDVLHALFHLILTNIPYSKSYFPIL